MNDHDREEWFGLYSLALLELERAVISERINEARISITARLEELKTLTGSRERERDAIEGALRNLRVIEREEARLAEEDRQRILRETIQNTTRSRSGIEQHIRLAHMPALQQALPHRGLRHRCQRPSRSSGLLPERAYIAARVALGQPKDKARFSLSDGRAFSTCTEDGCGGL
jgi:hypothetical protein